MKYIQFGYSRTGSTLIWNIADTLLDSKGEDSNNGGDKWLNPGTILKSHEMSDVVQHLNSDTQFLISIRHPLDCIKSKARVRANLKKVDEDLIMRDTKNIKHWIKVYTDTYRKLDKMIKDHRDQFLIIDYRYTNEVESLSQKIATFLDIPLTNELLEKIGNRVGMAIDNSKVESDFRGNYDPKTLVHPKHISQGDYAPKLDAYISNLRYYSKALMIYDKFYIFSSQDFQK